MKSDVWEASEPSLPRALQKLKIEGIDSVLEPAFDILATAVNVNNTLWQTVDTVKLVGAVLMGAMEPEIVIKESDVKFLINKEDDASGEKIPVAEMLGGTGAETVTLKSETDYKKVTETPDALAAIEAANAALLSLNNTLKEVQPPPDACVEPPTTASLSYD